MSEATVYLGWDVGGWEGGKDGLAALVWSDDGHLELAGVPCATRLKDALIGGGLSVDAILHLLGEERRWDRAVIGVDAPLGWPARFTEHVSAPLSPDADYLPEEPGEINNLLAYRHCDRVVARLCAKKPMSAVFDRLGNNATKAIAGCRQLIDNDNAVVAPQQAVTGRCVIIEGYPALWKQGALREGQLANGAAEALSECNLPPFGSDECDAVLAALSAACYDNQAGATGRDLPELGFPEQHFGNDKDASEIKRLLRTEGWIYFPRNAVVEDVSG